MLSPLLKGHVQVASASILFGTTGIFVSLTSQMPIGSIIFYRLLFGMAAIALFFACCGRLSELHPNEKKQYLLLLGILQAGTMLSYFVSVKYTTVSIAVDRPHLCHPPLSPHIKRGHHAAQAACAIVTTLTIFLPYSVAISCGVLLDNLYLLILLGILPTAASLALYFSGLAYVRAQNASIIALLEPISAVVFAFVILSQPITSTILAGGALILLGALMVSRERGVEAVYK